MFAVTMATKRQYLGQLENITRRLLELEKEVSVLLMADGRLPNTGLLCLMGFSLPDVFIKVAYIQSYKVTNSQSDYQSLLFK